MAAGLGFKDFTTGEVLTAADVDGYLMQGIWVFATATARDAAVTSPQEGNFAFTKDNNSLWYYDGAAWVASGATGDIEGVTAGIGISGGGTSGTVTVTNSMATAIDAKGDLVAGTGADTFAKLTVGANDTVLTADSTTATGLKWAAAAATGKPILQYVTASTTTPVSITSSSYTDSGLSASITPTLSTSKILVLILQPSYSYRSPGNAFQILSQILRGSTQIAFNDRFCRVWDSSTTTAELGYNSTFIYLDSPATTSATTYKTQYKHDGSSNTVIELQYNNSTSQIILMEIGA